MCKFMPAIFPDAMRDAPDTSVSLYEGTTLRVSMRDSNWLLLYELPCLLVRYVV